MCVCVCSLTTSGDPLQVLLLPLQHCHQPDHWADVPGSLHAFPRLGLPGNAFFPFKNVGSPGQGVAFERVAGLPAGTQPVVVASSILHHAAHSEYLSEI